MTDLEQVSIRRNNVQELTFARTFGSTTRKIVIIVSAAPRDRVLLSIMSYVLFGDGVARKIAAWCRQIVLA